MTPSPDPHPDASPPAPFRAASFSRDAGITAIVAVLFVLLRILAVARWNWATAAEVATTVDFGNAASLVFGTLFAEPLVTGILIIVLAPLVIIDLLFPSTTRQYPPLMRMLFLVGLSSVGGTLIGNTGRWWILAGTIAATGVLGAARVLSHHGVAHRALIHLMRSLGVLAVAGSLTMAAIVSTPWVGLERIETDSRVIYGYVLQTPSGYLKVLTEDTRQVIILISPSVSSRHIMTQ